MRATWMLVAMLGALGAEAAIRSIITEVIVVVTETIVVTSSKSTFTVPITETVTQTLTVLPPTTTSPTKTTTTSTLIVTYTPPTTATATSTVTVTATTPIVTYIKTTCKKTVKCASGTSFLADNQSCMHTYYGDDLFTTTCTIANCCTAKTTTTVTKSTTCVAAKVVCPANTLPLTDTKGASVPCLQTYKNNKLTSTTCLEGTCCTAATSTKKVACDQVIKCASYKVNSTTGIILKCRTLQGASDLCTVKRCCATTIGSSNSGLGSTAPTK